MANNQDEIKQLQEKLETLLMRQDAFSKEINNLQVEISKIRSETSESAPIKEEIKQNPSVKEEIKPKESPVIKKAISPATTEPTKQVISSVRKTPKTKSSVERFIGENLINKIGIAITIIGVAIGAKYSIEHNLISPLTRIILGYIAGLILLAFGIKLKKKYESYSVVLVSGAIAIMYFITYAAYAFYDLFPQLFAFVLMFIFTAFTVITAIHYNKQIVAHIGLVGAYAVPFMLGDGSGKMATFFTYVAIINIGILAVSIKRYWKSLYYTSLGFTWLIFLSWYVFKYVPTEQFTIAFSFLTLFFVLFYLTFIGYKLIRKEDFGIMDVILLISNAFVFYGFGYGLIDSQQLGGQYLGLFTLFNALIHFIVGVLFYKQKRADKNLFYLAVGLVLVFITIAIPVQLDGNWVTLLWVSEGTLLFWLGRSKNIKTYEKLSYVLLGLAFLSIIQDWLISVNIFDSTGVTIKTSPFFNINFLSSLLFIAAFGFLLFIHKKYNSTLKKDSFTIISIFIAAILLLVIYFTFRIEIATYWDQLFANSVTKVKLSGRRYLDVNINMDNRKFKAIWILNYSLFYFSILSFVNIKKVKSRLLGFISLGFIAFTLLLFLTQGLYVLSELRDNYLNQNISEYYHSGSFNIGIRYVSYAFVSLVLFAGYKCLRQDFMQNKLRIAFDYLLHISVLWIASSELINLLDISHSAQSYKLGLSILWGIYALFLIAIGIWKKKKHLRIGAIILFGITLLKLFFYDISGLNTISKTIVFVALGVLLLIISFLYNKYKHIISDETND